MTFLTIYKLYIRGMISVINYTSRFLFTDALFIIINNFVSTEHGYEDH